MEGNRLQASEGSSVERLGEQPIRDERLLLEGHSESKKARKASMQDERSNVELLAETLRRRRAKRYNRIVGRRALRPSTTSQGRNKAVEIDYTDLHVRVTLDLYVQTDQEEYNVEIDAEPGSPIIWEDLKNAIIEQIEEAVKESSNGSSISLSFADVITKVEKF